MSTCWPLVAEECAQYDGVTLDGESFTAWRWPAVAAPPVRNLLDNAQRHGRRPIRVELRRNGSRGVVVVSNAGRS